LILSLKITLQTDR